MQQSLHKVRREIYDILYSFVINETRMPPKLISELNKRVGGKLDDPPPSYSICKAPLIALLQL